MRTCIKNDGPGQWFGKPMLASMSSDTPTAVFLGGLAIAKWSAGNLDVMLHGR